MIIILHYSVKYKGTSMIEMLNRINYYIEIFSQMTLEDKSYLVQIISPIFVILTIIVTILIYLGQKSMDRREQLVVMGPDLERLSDYMAYIYMVIELENEEIYQLAISKNPLEIKDFTYEEMYRLYSAEQIEQLNTIFLPNKNYDNISIQTLQTARDRFYYLFNTPTTSIKEENLQSALCHEFYRMVFWTMNKWTTLCIAMTEGVTLEKIMFKSMGKNYVQFITTNYAFIANLNKNVNPVTKKMKFIAVIYNKWKKKLHRQEKKQMLRSIFCNLIKKEIGVKGNLEAAINSECEEELVKTSGNETDELV